MTDDLFDEIVCGFHRAAQGDCGWIDALLPFQRAMDAYAVHLHGVDSARGRIVFSHNASALPPEVELDYVRLYHRIDPRANLAIGQPEGQWVNCWDHFDEEFVAGSPFYQEFLIPYGGRYASGLKLLQDGDVAVMIGVHRGIGQPVLSAEEIATCARLCKHLRAALLVQKRRIGEARQSRLGLDLLMRLKAPVALIDGDRQLLQTNASADGLLQRSKSIYVKDGRLFCSRSADDSELVIGVRCLLDAHSGPSTGSEKLFIRASSERDDQSVGLYFYPLSPSETLHAFGDHKLAMLLLYERGIHLELDPFVVAAAFDLTPGEARVAVATSRGATPAEIALAFNVSTHTVRAQLASVFHKTGTARQAELVSVLSCLPMAGLGLRVP